VPITTVWIMSEDDKAHDRPLFGVVVKRRLPYCRI
jgi:hypothetical protein